MLTSRLRPATISPNIRIFFSFCVPETQKSPIKKNRTNIKLKNEYHPTFVGQVEKDSALITIGEHSRDIRADQTEILELKQRHFLYCHVCLGAVRIGAALVNVALAFVGVSEVVGLKVENSERGSERVVVVVLGYVDVVLGGSVAYVLFV